MKIKLKLIIPTILMLLLIVILSIIMINTNLSKAAKEEMIYKILEIVPYKGMGEVGYLVGGQEPIDQELMSIDKAGQDLNFLNGAISVYPSYEENPESAHGSINAMFTEKDGYFTWELITIGDGYELKVGDVAERVAEGTGTHIAKLGKGTVLDDTYRNTNRTINYKNVNAYFVYGKPEGVTLLNENTGYEPYSVTRNETNHGDYDYDLVTGRFTLNKGKGAYDVLFVSSNKKNEVYYMTSDYEVITDNSGAYSVHPDKITYETVEKGNFIINKNKKYFQYTSGLNFFVYRFTEAKVPSGQEEFKQISGKTWARRQRILTEYKYTYHVELLNQEWFKQLNLELPASEPDDYKIEVHTMTPEDLKATENHRYIEEADFIYINANYNQNPNYINLYEKYSQEGLNLPPNKKYSSSSELNRQDLNFANYDLTWTVVEKIFKRAAGIVGDKATVLFDDTFYLDAVSDDYSNPYKDLKKKLKQTNSEEEKTGTLCNAAKLYIMLQQRDLNSFYHTYLKPDTASYPIREVSYKVGKKTVNTGSLKGSGTSLDEDAVIYWNEDTFKMIDRDPVAPEEDGTEDSNYRTFKRILNIQPTADYKISEQLIRSILSGYRLQIVNMTSVQFNGSREDINSRYDMIFMGCSAGRFNEWFEGTKYDFTVFNDFFNMSNYAYFTKGDKISIRNEKNKEEEHRFTGNDITLQKKMELEEFLSAGYPIVLDAELYNNYHVKNDTNIYRFIRGAQGKTNFLNAQDLTYDDTGKNVDPEKKAKKIEAKVKLTDAISILRPRIKLHNPMEQEGSELQITFTLPQKGLLPNLQTYDATAYLDWNGDSIFDEAEKIEIDPNGGWSWTKMRESLFRIYSGKYDLSNQYGVYQWKLVVTRRDNQNIRSFVTGYIVHSNPDKETINILHIRENASAYDMENKLENEVGSLLEIYGKRELDDYTLEIDTKTVMDFQQSYADMPYEEENGQTNQLSNYHLIIMDNPNTKIRSDHGAADNFKDEIEKGMSVIYTKNALGYGDDLSKSFINNYTYNYLNQRRAPRFLFQQLYSFEDMKGDFELDLSKKEAYDSSYLSKNNEGAITRYPYPINQAIKMATNSYSTYATVDFDLSVGQRLVGWYSISDSRSPLISTSGLGPNRPINEYYYGTYSSSPNDVKNNYYLFSNGLCYYSGIRLDKADRSGNDDEMKLFINTIIAAYQASYKEISNYPVIEFYDPPVSEKEGQLYIKVKQDNIKENEFILTFDLNSSAETGVGESTNMNVTITWDNTDPEGSWNNIIYPVVGGFLQEGISIDNTKHEVPVGRYAVKIPENKLNGDNRLKISAKNKQNLQASKEVTIRLAPVIEITHPKTYKNDQSEFIYVDIDYNTVETEERLLSNTGENGILKIQFKVSKADAFRLSITSDEDLVTDSKDNPYSIVFYKEGESGYEIIEPEDVQEPGNYAVDIPLDLLKQRGSREFKLIATDIEDIKGVKSVTLLRRNLFPLD